MATTDPLKVGTATHMGFTSRWLLNKILSSSFETYDMASKVRAVLGTVTLMQ